MEIGSESPYWRYSCCYKNVHLTKSECKGHNFGLTTMMQRNHSVHTAWEYPKGLSIMAITGNGLIRKSGRTHWKNASKASLAPLFLFSLKITMLSRFSTSDFFWKTSKPEYYNTHLFSYICSQSIQSFNL